MRDACQNLEIFTFVNICSRFDATFKQPSDFNTISNRKNIFSINESI